MYFSAVSATVRLRTVSYIEAATVVLYVLYSAMMTYVFKAPVHICYTVNVYHILIALLSYAYIRSGNGEKEMGRAWIELTRKESKRPCMEKIFLSPLSAVRLSPFR